MKKSILVPFLLLIFSYSFSQKRIDPTPEHIAQAKALKEQFSDVDVVLLKSKDHVTFNLNKKATKLSVFHKTDEHLMNISSRADIQKYVFYDNESSVARFDIHYRNKRSAPINLKDESYTSNDLFHNDARVKFAHLDFPVQGYTYFFGATKRYKDIKYFTTLYFTGEYPILEKEIKIVVPTWLDIEFKELNFEGHDITKTVTSDKKSKTKTITYKATNVIAGFDEKKSPGPSYIYPHILVLAKSYTHKDKTHTLFNETKDLYNWYKSLVDSMEDDTTSLKEKVAELTANAATDEEKIKNIYYWVQDNIRYIAFEDGIAGFKPDESQNVFKKRYGDCKGMANLTKQMLTEAGFDARLTWIGTKRIAYDYTTPSLSVDNHMICTLLKDGKKIYLDGTEKHSAYKEYAERIQGKQVMIEDGDSFMLEKVPTTTFNENKETYSFHAKIKGDVLTGNIAHTFSGESRASFLYIYNSLKNDKKKEALRYYLDSDDKNLSVSNIQTSDLNNREQDISITCNLEQKNAVSSFDDEIYLDLNYSKEFQGFNFEKRKTAYLFSHKRYYESEIQLEIPSGYKIQELPKPIEIDHTNYKIDVRFELKGNTLHYKKLFIIKNAIIEPSDFTEWNAAIKKLQAIYKEQIILVK